MAHNVSMAKWTRVPWRDAKEVDAAVDCTDIPYKQGRVLRLIAWHIMKHHNFPSMIAIARYLGRSHHTLGARYINSLLSRGKIARVDESRGKKNKGVYRLVGVKVRLERETNDGRRNEDNPG